MFDLFRSRDKAVRIFLGAILVVVALSMITYLIPGGGFGGGGTVSEAGTLADVAGDPITVQQARTAIAGVTRGRQMPPEIMSFYVPQIVQQMITERALAYEAKRIGLKVSDDETATAIRSTLPPQLFKDGKVDTNMYASVLAEQNMTISQFESEMARSVLVARLRQVIAEGTVVAPGEVEQEYKHRTEKTKIEYAMISPAKYQSEAQPTEAEMRTYFDRSRAQYQTPEKKSIAVLLLDSAKVAEAVQVSDADLQKAYDANKNAFRTPERVKIRHILLKTDAAKGDDAKVKAKAEDLLKQLRGGADFAEMAKKNSEDPGSGAKGGDLDWVSRGQMVKPFEDAAFSLPPKQLSNLVQTQYGYHILEVMEKENARLKPFEEVKGEIALNVKKRQSSQVTQSLADKALAGLKKDPLHPEKIASELNLPLIQVPNYVPGDPIPQIGVSKPIDDSLAGLKKGDVTQPVTLTGDKLAFASVTGVDVPHPATFEEVKSQVQSKLSGDKLARLLDQRAKELLDKTKSMGGDLEQAAKSMGLEMKTPAEFDRQGAVEGIGSGGLLGEAFDKPAGHVFGPITAQGSRVVAKVLQQIPPDMNGMAAQSASIRDEIKQKRGRERTTLFEEGVKTRLEKDGKLKVHQDVVNQLVASFRG